MSANQWIICGKCRMNVETKLKESYGKLTNEDYNLFKSWVDDYSMDADDELRKVFEKLDINIHSSKWDNEYNSEFECAYDYNYKTTIDGEGNLCFQYSGTCDCCGVEHNIELILPEGVTENQEYKIDLRGINLKELKSWIKQHNKPEETK